MLSVGGNVPGGRHAPGPHELASWGICEPEGLALLLQGEAAGVRAAPGLV